MITVEAVCEVQPLASGKGESPPIFPHPAFPVQPPQLGAQASSPSRRAAGVLTRIDQAQRWHWKQEVGGTGPMWKLEKLLLKDEAQFPAQGFPGFFLRKSFCKRLSICCLIYLSSSEFRADFTLLYQSPTLICLPIEMTGCGGGVCGFF